MFLLVAVVAARAGSGARGDGAVARARRRAAIFFRVVLPQLRPALLGGVLLVALDTLVEFDAFVALKYQTFSVRRLRAVPARLQRLRSGGALVLLDRPVRGAALRRGALRGNANYTRVSHGARRAHAPLRARPRSEFPCSRGFGALVAVSVGIPLGAARPTGSRESSDAALASAGGSLHYLLPATVTSVDARGRRGAGRARPRAAGRGARGSLPRPARRRRSSARPTSRSRSPISSRRSPLAYAASHYAPFLYGSFALLVFAEAILFLPFAVVALRATLGQIEPALEDSARSLGAGAVCGPSGA